MTVAPLALGVDTKSSRRWWSLLVVCLGVMMAFVNVSSTISALPFIQNDLHAESSVVVWISSAYSLAVVSLVMSAGTLADLAGRRRVFIGGAAVVTIGSILAFFATSAGVLIAAQAVMGLGGAAVLPASLSSVSAAFTDPHERTSAISIWAACSGLGLAFGPLLAGVLLNHYSWHFVFLINVVVGVLALALAPLFVEESRHPSRQLDPVGVLFGTLAIAAATFAIIEGGAVGYGNAPIIVAYVVFGTSSVVFARYELRHHDPMLDLRLFKSPSFAMTMTVGAATMFGFVGISLLTVLYLEKVRSVDALATGVRLLPMFLSYIVVTAVAARAVRRVGFTVPLTVGVVLMGIGALALLRVGPTDSYGSMWPGLLIAGVGAGMLVAPSTAAAVNSVPPLQAGMASASVNMFRQLGSVLGPSVLGTIATTRFPHYLHDRLSEAGLPAPAVRSIVHGATHGQSRADLPAKLSQVVSASAAEAFTSAIHVALVVGGVILLLMAIPTAAFVRHRHPSS